MKHLPSLCLSLLLMVSLSSCGIFKNGVHLGTRDGTTTSTNRTPRKPRKPRTTTGTSPRDDRDNESPSSYIRTDIVNHAQELLGLKYKYGGNNPKQGFDCSGFVLYLYQNAGVDIERVSREQAKQGINIPFDEAQPGDLVFFKRKGKAVHHVSVIVESGINRMVVVHATNSGVIRENVLESRYWEPMIYQVRRVLE